MKKNTQRVMGLFQIGIGLIILNTNPVNPDGSQTPGQVVAATKLVGALGGMAITIGGITILNAKD